MVISMKRVGIVGCGNIAGTHAWALKQMRDVKIVGFADTVIQRAENFSKTYTGGEAIVCYSLAEMLHETKIDILHICTPHYLHVPMILEAMNSGVSVFSEKPPAIDMEQFMQLREVNRNENVRLGFCFQNRYNKTIAKTDEILMNGRLGQVTGSRAFVTWRRDADYYINDWKGKLATEGGGALINQSIHTLDLMLRYLGEPVTVQASVSNHHLPDIVEVEDTVEAWMTFANGERACFYATTAYATDAPVIFELQCENGSITIIDKNVIVREVQCEPEYYVVEESIGMGKNYWGSGHLACIRDFYDKLDSGERFQNDLDGVRTTMETMMKIYDFR